MADDGLAALASHTRGRRQPFMPLHSMAKRLPRH